MNATLIQAVGYAEDILKEKAEQIARQLHLILDKTANPCLFVDHDKLALKYADFKLLYAEFDAVYWEQKKDKKQGLIKACKPGPNLKIVDATAGWGRDAALLASFGAQVTLCERHSLMAALLEDALSRSNALDLHLIKGDAQTYLQSLVPEDYPDVVYIDPMHPTRSKSALVKKDLQVLQQIIGTDQDALSLLQCARAHVKQRVVVKWPQKLPPLLPATSSIPGKTIRFDVYCVA